MKSRFIVVFFLVVAVIVAYAMIPVVKEANKPVNKFIREAKSDGGVPLIQFVANQSQAQNLQEEIAAYNRKPGNTLIVGKSFPADGNMEFVHKYNASVPGFIVLDADDNVAFKREGVANAEILSQLASGIHTH